MSTWILRTIAASGATAGLFSSVKLLAAESKSTLPAAKAVDSTREALDSSWIYPWYDPKTDELKRIRLPREFDWPDWSWSWPWNWSLPDFSWIKVISWGLVLLLLALITYFLVRFWLDQRRGRRPGKAAAKKAPQRSARIEDLPFQLDANGGNLLALAEDHYRSGDYSRAVIYLYSHELMELDRQQRIRLIRGKTNRQYLRDLAPHPRLRKLLEQTVHAFEEAFFGGRSISQQRCAACFGDLGTLTTLAKSGE